MVEQLSFFNSEKVPQAGLGWELFKKYLIAIEKFKPDYFLFKEVGL